MHPGLIARTTLLGLLAAATFAIQAQGPAPAASAASAPLNKNLPTQRTPAEVRNSATPPGELRPENQVVPQITVPLGRADKSAAIAKDAQAQSAKRSAQADGETPASCLAKVKPEDREACMSRVHRSQGSKPKTP